MGAGARRGEGVAVAAEEGRLELQRRDTQLFEGEAVEDLLGLVAAVELPDAGMVAANDEASDAVVLPDEGVEERFPRPRVAHGRRECREERAAGRIVLVDEDLVGAEPDCGRHVVVLGLADEGVDDQAVGELEGQLGQVLVGAVDRIAGLEACDVAPAADPAICSRSCRGVRR